MNDRRPWGCDVPVSMPEPVDPSAVLIDFGSHVFTPDGMRINMSSAVREDLLAAAYRPADAEIAP